MVVVQSYFVAVLMCVITMLCWGLFYWDYSLGVLILSLILAFIMGSSGEEGKSFLADLGQG